MIRPRRSAGVIATSQVSLITESGLAKKPSRKRSGIQARMSCVQAMAIKVSAARIEHRIASRAAPTRLASTGIKGAETMKPSGVIAADRPIRPGVVPCRSRMKLSSG